MMLSYYGIMSICGFVLEPASSYKPIIGPVRIGKVALTGEWHLIRTVFKYDRSRPNQLGQKRSQREVM